MENKELLRILLGTVFIRSEEGCIVGETAEFEPVTIGEVDGQLWLTLSIYDKDLDDSRELEYQIIPANTTPKKKGFWPWQKRK